MNWLIKKNYLKTITVGGTMRVMIDSFEKWYANGNFELIKVGRYNRATKESFEKWYQSQNRYRLVAEDGEERSCRE